MPARKHIPLEEVIKAYEETGSCARAAKRLGCDASNVSRRLANLWRRMEGKVNDDKDIPNYSPGAGRVVRSVNKQMDSEGRVKFYSVREEPEAPDTEFAEKLAKPARVSTLRGADGSIRAQWEITKPEDEDRVRAIMDAVEGFKEQIPAVLPTQMVDGMVLDKLTNLYVLSDSHIGGLAWAPESGADWDLKIAEDTMTRAFSAMIQQSPRAKNAFVALLGDWMHYDKLEAMTTLSGNMLDGDGRQMKMNKAAIRIARRIINQALQHHEHVFLLVAEGNHDILGAPWLKELFMVAFEMEPRVTVIDDPRPFYGVVIGDIFIGFHHGHLRGMKDVKSMKDLVAVFMSEFREEYGRTKHSYIHTGHFHNELSGTYLGTNVVRHPTLAARDAHASRHAWQNIRSAIGTTYHEKTGRTGTVEVTLEMLADV